MIKVDARIKRFFACLGGIILILYVFKLYLLFLSFQEVEDKLIVIRPNFDVNISLIAEIKRSPKNSWYFKYNYDNNDTLCSGELEFSNLLDMVDAIGKLKITKGSNLPVLYNMDRPEYSLPILRKRWLRKHQITIPDSMIKYIPYD